MHRQFKAQIPLSSSRLARHVRRVERVETSLSSVSSRAVPTWRTTNRL